MCQTCSMGIVIVAKDKWRETERWFRVNRDPEMKVTLAEVRELRHMPAEQRRRILEAQEPEAIRRRV
jgi:hypothetical protein